VALLALLVVATLDGAQPPEQTPATKRLIRIAAPLTEGDICDAAELKDRDGSTTILATVDFSGRRFCNMTLRIRRGPPPVVIQELPMGTPDRVNDLLEDLNGDGYPEILGATYLTPYRGGRCAAVVRSVYTCSAQTCVKSTSHFPRFLRRELQRTEADLAQAISEQASAEDQACLEMSRDKLKRMLRIDPTAGFSTAKAWLAGNDSTLRENGALVLHNIDNSEARQILGGLVDDRDRHVADVARRNREGTRR
jgi:hypothetical protein